MKRPALFFLLACCLFAFPARTKAQFLPPFNTCDMEFTVQDSSGLCDYFMLTAFRFLLPAPNPPTSMIIDKNLEVVWYMQHDLWTLDFKLQPNGNFTYCERYDWVVLDSSFAAQDTFKCIGYTTDPHDMQVLPNGNYLLLCYEDTIADLSSLLTTNGMPGDSAGHLLATVIQEQDPQHIVVRNWHAFDHYTIFDADPRFFTNPTRMELNHSNSLDMNADGLLLMSNRANHDVACIDWATGDLKWRLGGVSGDFTLLNTNPMSAQHDARWQPDGTISIFDNGTLNNPFSARGLVYSIDTTQMNAELVWEHANPTVHSDGLGSFRVLPNGNGILNYGSITNMSQDDVLMINHDSTFAWGLDLQNSYYSYRSFCQDLPYAFPRPEIQCSRTGGNLTLSVVGQPSQVLWHDGQTSPSITVTAPGPYQVYVPHGEGWVGSKVFHVVDPSTDCGSVSIPEWQSGGSGRPALKTYSDVLGRPVTEFKPGQVVIEQGSAGSRKFVVW